MGYDTTGDGNLDSFDTTGDGKIDTRIETGARITQVRRCSCEIRHYNDLVGYCTLGKTREDTLGQTYFPTNC